MPRVRIPVGPFHGLVRIVPLKYKGAKGTNPYNRCTNPRKRGWEGFDARTQRPLCRAMTTVCTCNPGVHWTHTRVSYYSESNPIIITWLLCHLVNGSAQAPTKDVSSCEKLQGVARRLRTADFRMGIPTAIASRNGERRELKHLSIGRKRKQTRYR